MEKQKYLVKGCISKDQQAISSEFVETRKNTRNRQNWNEKSQMWGKIDVKYIKSAPSCMKDRWNAI